MKKNTFQIILLLVILFLQLVFLWISFDKNVPININSILTVVGWFAVYYFGFRQSKNKISLEKKVEIYEKLVNLKEELDDAFVFDLTVTASHQPFDLDNSTTALDHAKELSDKLYISHKKYQKFDNCIRAWIFLMPELEKASVILAREYYKFNDELNLLVRLFQDYSISLSSKGLPAEMLAGRKIIDKAEIIAKRQEIFDKSANIINFIDDFMELVCNNLVAPVFHFRMRRSIENLKEGQLHKKLTISGIADVPYKMKDYQRDNLL